LFGVVVGMGVSTYFFNIELEKMSEYYLDQIENLSENYLYIVEAVIGIDYETIRKDYEHCSMLLNDEIIINEFNNTI
jgi:uncharacterized radical SAM superfamily protein